MKITLDTNIIPADERNLEVGTALGWEFAVVSVTERELAATDLAVSLKVLGAMTESAVWGESKWGGSVWGSQDDSTNLNDILRVISSGSFPVNRDPLSSGQRRKLRDAMIFHAHVRDRRDIFVTKDSRAFIDHGRRKTLEELFETKIMTPEEFWHFCRGQQQSRRGVEDDVLGVG